MPIIVPTITTDDPALLAQNFTKFSAFSRRIQLDASDGTFAPTNLVPLAGLQLPSSIAVDIHLMSARPSDHLSTLLNLKPSLCILHAEVDDDLASILAELKNAGIKTGLAFVKSTYPGKYADLLKTVDHAMIFAGQLGSQGGNIDMMQTEKVALLRNLKPDLEIGWDGGANLSNVRALTHAGVDVINVGSAISRAADPAAMYQSLISEADKKGVLV